MKYLKNLFLSLKEVFIVMLVQYALLIGTILILGFDKSVLVGTFILMIFEVGYVIYKFYGTKINVKKDNYFPYILLGLSITSIYNMIIFKIGIKFDMDTSIPLVINLLASAFIGPIFEEILFRYVLLEKLEKFNSKVMTIILGGIIFGLFHNNLVTIIYASIIGIVNSYLYIDKKNIIIPIVIHIAANTLSTFLFDYNPIILGVSIILLIISSLIIKKV